MHWTFLYINKQNWTHVHKYCSIFTRYIGNVDWNITCFSTRKISLGVGAVNRTLKWFNCYWFQFFWSLYLGALWIFHWLFFLLILQLDFLAKIKYNLILKKHQCVLFMRLCMVVIKFSGGITISFCDGVWIFIVALPLRAHVTNFFFYLASMTFFILSLYLDSYTCCYKVSKQSFDLILFHLVFIYFSICLC